MSELEALESSLTWARHSAATRWCAVESFAGGSVHTRCAGRFSLRDTWAACGDPPSSERCGGCNDSIAAAAEPEKLVSRDFGKVTTETTSLVSGPPEPFKACTGPETVGGDRLSHALAELRGALVVETVPAPLWEATMLDERLDDGGES